MASPNQQDVTVILPVYNGKAFVREAVESVIKQSQPPAELIVVDDGSTDGSLEVLKDLATSFPITLISQTNAGQSAARNRGVSLAETALIAFLDQDDHWYLRHLELLGATLRADPAVGWAYSELDLVDLDGKVLIPKFLAFTQATHPKTVLEICLSEDNMFILPSASLIRKEAFTQVGGFDARLSGYEDDDLFLRLFQRGWKNSFINEPLSAWRSHTGSSMHSVRMIQSRRLYAEKLLQEFPDRPERNSYHTRDCIAPRFYRLNAVDYWRGVRAGDPKLCAEALRVMREYAPIFDRRWRMRAKLRLMAYPRLMKPLGEWYERLAKARREAGR